MRFITIAYSFLMVLGSNTAVNAQENAAKKTATGILGYAGRLSGNVTKIKSDTPLAGASVYISDLKIGAVADGAGHYNFKTLPAGTYLVEAHYTGFKTVTKNVTINGDVTVDFKLEENIVEESAVVVTGLSKATQIKRSPIPIVSVSKAYMLRSLSTNIIDAIARIPGVNAITTGPNISKPTIRGLGANRILTLYDGVRQEGQQWGDEHGVEVDQYGIEKVEIFKK
jgi:iron complex outermembrane receptor protein